MQLLGLHLFPLRPRPLTPVEQKAARWQTALAEYRSAQRQGKNPTPPDTKDYGVTRTRTGGRLFRYPIYEFQA